MATKRMYRQIGPKDVFKHIILNQLMPRTAQRYSNGYTLLDFTPGPGHYHLKDAGLGLLYRYGAMQHQKTRVNPFQHYIAALMEYNGEVDPQKLLRAPEKDFEPELYPSSAGFASLYLRDVDRAIFIEDDRHTNQSLRDNLQWGRNVSIIEGHKSLESISKALVPPVNGNALVCFDTDLSLEKIEPRGEFQLQFFAEQAAHIKKVGRTIENMIRRFPTGTYFIPYPMTSIIAPLDLVRSVLRSGATQVLNCSMYLEKGIEGESAEFAGSGVGALIVNPPADLDHALKRDLPHLKTDVFMPAILLDEGTEVGETNVRYLTMNEQPWDDLLESAKKQTWDYSKKAKWTPSEWAEHEKLGHALDDNEYKNYLNVDHDANFDEAAEHVKNGTFPQPRKFDPNNADDEAAKRAWRDGLDWQYTLQDSAGPTKIKVKKKR